MRTIGAVLLGLVAGVLVVFAIEFLSIQLYPLPSGIDPGDPAAMATAIAHMPLGAFMFVLAAYFSGTLVGSFLAARVGRGIVPGMVVGVLLLVAALMTMVQLPHPLWFWIAAVLLFAAATFVGTRLGSPIVARPAAA